jgi:serine/threonine-protein kinase RsbW
MWSALPGPDGVPPVLDMTFDSGTLHTLRAEVRVRAVRAGLPERRAEDVVLAVHELAANSVRHAGGAGRLRMWNLARALHCQVDDGDGLGAVEPVSRLAASRSASGWMLMNSLPCVPGHGLWVVQQVADQVRSLSGSRGTSVMITFESVPRRHTTVRMVALRGVHGPAGLPWSPGRRRSAKEGIKPRAQIKDEKTYQKLRDEAKARRSRADLD